MKVLSKIASVSNELQTLVLPLALILALGQLIAIKGAPWDNTLAKIIENDIRILITDIGLWIILGLIVFHFVLWGVMNIIGIVPAKR